MMFVHNMLGIDLVFSARFYFPLILFDFREARSSRVTTVQRL